MQVKAFGPAGRRRGVYSARQLLVVALAAGCVLGGRCPAAAGGPTSTGGGALKLGAVSMVGSFPTNPPMPTPRSDPDGRDRHDLYAADGSPAGDRVDERADGRHGPAGSDWANDGYRPVDSGRAGADDRADASYRPDRGRASRTGGPGHRPHGSKRYDRARGTDGLGDPDRAYGSDPDYAAGRAAAADRTGDPAYRPHGPHRSNGSAPVRGTEGLGDPDRAYGSDPDYAAGRASSPDQTYRSAPHSFDRPDAAADPFAPRSG